MTDEDKKRIVSEPPPPTDEIDGEWDDDETLVRDAPSLSDPPKVSVRPSAPASSPPAAAAPSVKPQAAQPAETAAAPISDPPVATSGSTVEDEDEEDEDEEDGSEGDDEDEEDEDEDEDEEGEDEASAQPTQPSTASPEQDWIPEWGPLAVLGLLVCVSIVFGLGLIGGPARETSDEQPAAPAPSALKPKARPSPH